MCRVCDVYVCGEFLYESGVYVSGWLSVALIELVVLATVCSFGGVGMCRVCDVYICGEVLCQCGVYVSGWLSVALIELLVLATFAPYMLRVLLV